MFCRNCGEQLDEGAVFCKKCGQKVEQNQVTEAGRPTGTQAQNVAGGQEMPKASSRAASKLFKNKFFWGGIGAAVVALIVIIIVVSRPKKINLNDYVTVEFNGYDTVGTARIVYDEDGLTSAVAKALKISEKDLENIEDFSDLFSGDYLTKMEELYTCLDLYDASLDKSSDLSNGDTVTLTFECDNETAKEHNIVFEGQDVVYTVEGLGAITVIDAFADLSVSFTGVGPNGRAEYEYTGDTSVIDTYNFNFDNAYNLKNGDTVTVSLNINENSLLSSGYKVKELTRTYTVEGLDEYVAAYSDLTEDFLEYTKTEAQDMISAYVAKQYNDECSLGEMEYAGYIFYTPKEDAGYFSNYNDLYVLYRGVVAHAEGEFQNTMVYFPVHFYNILSGEDGLNCERDDNIWGSSSLGNTWYSTRGYANPLTAYTELVTAKIDAYTVEPGDGFEVFSEYAPITAIADINSDNIALLESDALDTISAYMTNRHSDATHAENLAVLGYYMLFAKNPGSDFSQNNRMYVVYSTTLTNDDGDFEPTTVYYVVQFEGVINLPNGEFMYMKNKGLIGYTSLPGSWSSTSGYLDGVELYDDVVTANRANYTYEVSDGLKEFGE